MTNPKHTDTSRSDLVERLRGDKYTCRKNMGCGTMEFCACATMEDAAAHIQALEAENERLREALGKLASMVDWMPHPDCVTAEQIIRAALGDTQ